MARKNKSVGKTKNSPAKLTTIGKKKFDSDRNIMKSSRDKALRYHEFAKFVKKHPSFLAKLVLKLEGSTLSDHKNRLELVNSLVELLGYTPEGGGYFSALTRLRELPAQALPVELHAKGAPELQVAYRMERAKNVPPRHQSLANRFLGLSEEEKELEELHLLETTRGRVHSPLYLGTVLDTGLVHVQVHGEIRGTCSLWQACTGLLPYQYNKFWSAKDAANKVAAETKLRKQQESAAKAALLEELLAPVKANEAKAKAEAEAMELANWANHREVYSKEYADLREAYAKETFHMVEWDANLLSFLRAEGPAEGSKLACLDMLGAELYTALCYFLIESNLEGLTSPQIRELTNKGLMSSGACEHPLFSGPGYYEEDAVKFQSELPPLDNFATKVALEEYLDQPHILESLGKEVGSFKLLLSSDKTAS